MVYENLRVYCQPEFVQESTACPRDGKVLERIKKVSQNEKELGWNLLEFFDNCLFLVECQTQGRKIFVTRSHQINECISEDTQGLQQLSYIIQVGDILPDRNKSIEFWIGSRPVIQKSFEQSKINAETTSWKQTTAQAEIVEISKNEVDWRDCKLGSSISTPLDMGPASVHLERESRSREQTLANAVIPALSGTRRNRFNPLSGCQFWTKVSQRLSEQYEKPLHRDSRETLTPYRESPIRPMLPYSTSQLRAS